MARTMNDGEARYEVMSEADFDNPPAGPVGVHRGKRSWPVRFLPFIIVIVGAVVVGLLTWGFITGEISRVHFPWQKDASTTSQSQEVDSSSIDAQKEQSDSAPSSSQSSPQSNSTSSDTANKNSAQSNSSSQQDSNTTQNGDSSAQSTDKNSNSFDTTKGKNSDGTSGIVNKAAAIRVVNATHITGHAAQKATLLKNAGYTQVTATNPNGTLPKQTVVWYQNAADKATAQDIAKVLGITNVQHATDIRTPIVVVLLN